MELRYRAQRPRMNTTLGPLPEQKYKVMAPFFRAYGEGLKAEGLKPPGANFSSPPETWDFKSNRLSKPMARGEISPKTAWARVSETQYPQHYRRQLMVRDFFSQWDEVPLRESWVKYPWDIITPTEQRKRLALWKDGATGYDVIDASMIQLREEGFISNRQRMLCCSYLAKNLLVDWQLGERWFASQLEDYNRQSNKGNWAWVSGAAFNTRLGDVMNPDLQRRKIDPQKTLVQKYLKDRESKMLIPFPYPETKARWLKIVT